MRVAVKNNLENELYTPPQVWDLMIALGWMLKARDKRTSIYLERSIQKTESLLHGFILDHRALLRGDLR